MANPRLIKLLRQRMTIAVAAITVAGIATGIALVVSNSSKPATDPLAATVRQDDRANRSENRVDVGQTPTGTPSPTATKAPAKPKPTTRTTAPKTTTSKPATTNVAGCSAYKGNKAIACAMLPNYGWSTSQMPALDKLWTRESGWNARAANPSSGAYGIPQALPGSKMATAGSDWRTNPATQIKWGLSYIKSRYGSPNAAWAHSQATGWY